MIRSISASAFCVEQLLCQLRVCTAIVMGAMLGACSTMDAVSDGVVDAATMINPLNWIDDEDEKVEGKTYLTSKKNTGEAKDLEEVETKVPKLNGKTDSRRKSRSAKNPSSMLYGDNRLDKSYPKLGNIPDRPTSEAALIRRIQHKKLADGLVADSENAQYTDKVLRASSAVTPPPPNAAPVSEVEAQRVSAPKLNVTPNSAKKSDLASPQKVLSSPGRANALTTETAKVQAPRPIASPAVIKGGTSDGTVSPPGIANKKRPLNASLNSKKSQTPVPGIVPPPPPPTAYQRDSEKQFATPVGRPRVVAEVPKVAHRKSDPPPSPPALTERPSTVQAPSKAVAQEIGNENTGLVETSMPLSRVPQTVQVATIYFDNGSSRLQARDRAVVHDVVAMFEETGGAIRIVGHSSGITASRNSGRGKLVNFKVSLDRANSVAAELVRNGVPAKYIDVVAHGADSPVYAEYSPNGAAGNRRAEVYLQYVSGM
ncbi:MAG: OmpA family protein [Pseudomonadota bacterium]|nr:OmpA family protein [Pseudomonadota bacterium]